MKVAIAGATGFVGEHLIPILCEKYEDVRCLVRNTSDVSRISLHNVNLYYGDISKGASLKELLDGVDRFIYLVPFSTGYIHEAVSSCVEAGVRRALFVGTTQIFTYQEPELKKKILEAEKAIISAALDYTILRPTLIYGSMLDKNIFKLVCYLKKYPVIFIPGDGKSLQRPVLVDDICLAIISAIESPATIRKAYNIAGKDAITFNEMIKIICNALCVRRVKIHIPNAFMIFLAKILRVVGIRSYITEDKIRRLAENKDFAYDDAARDFGYTPLSFEEGINEAVQRYQT